MAVKRRERRGTFTAHDHAGNEYDIVVYVDVHTGSWNRNVETDGLVTLETNSAEPVIHNGHDRFTIRARSGHQFNVKSNTHYVCEDWTRVTVC
jgi:hypothetical protein